MKPQEAIQFIDFTKKLKLNLGCGYDLKEGYVNVDWRELPRKLIPQGIIYVESDIRNLSWLPNKCASEIFARCVLEHIHTDEVTSVLFEWNRVLDIGGLLIFEVPDFDALIDAYLSIRDHIDQNLYLFKKINYHLLNSIFDYMALSGPGGYHQSLWSRSYVSVTLPTEGFKVVSMDNCGQYNFILRVVAQKEMDM